jgi:hypothetical protein
VAFKEPGSRCGCRPARGFASRRAPVCRRYSFGRERATCATDHVRVACPRAMRRAPGGHAAAHHGRRAIARRRDRARVASRRRRDSPRIRLQDVQRGRSVSPRGSPSWPRRRTITQSWRSPGAASPSVSRPTPSAGSRGTTSSWPRGSTDWRAAERSLGCSSELTAQRVWLDGPKRRPRSTACSPARARLVLLARRSSFLSVRRWQALASRERVPARRREWPDESR